MAECVPPDEPPPRGACDGYPHDWQEVPLTIGEGENAITELVCTKFFDEEDTQDCSVDPSGIVRFNQNEYIACEDKFSECLVGGGDWGLFNDHEVCIPGDFDSPSEERPECTDGMLQLINPEDGGGSWACITPIEPYEPPDVPGSEDHPDIDGDGIPDHLDDDMDGDGIPNDQDSDADGDGTPDDQQEGPVGGDGKNDVTGGLGCDVRPSCKGDAIQCSINYQIWASRCKSELTEDQPDENPGELDLEGDDIEGALETTLTEGVDALTGEGAQGVDSALDGLKGLVSGLIPSSGGCTDLTLTYNGHVATVPCAKTAQLRDLLGWALYILTAWYLFKLATTPLQARGQ